MVFSLGIFAFYHHGFSVPGGVLRPHPAFSVLHLTNLIAAIKCRPIINMARLVAYPQEGTSVVLNLEYWRKHAQSYGLWPTLKHLGHRLGNQVVPHTTLVCIYITLQVPDKQFLKVPEGLTGRFLAADELHALTAICEYGISKEFLSDALAKGDECYALLQGSRVVTFGWYSRQATAVNEELTLHFDPAYVYMYFGYTHPDYRGKRLHAFGMTHALRSYTERGGKGLVSFVESDNFASLRSCERMGYKEAGRIRSTKIGGKYRIRASKGCDAFGFRLVPNKIPARTVPA